MPILTTILKQDKSPSNPQECDKPSKPPPKSAKDKGGAAGGKKPVLRHIHHANTVRNIYTALTLSVLGGTLFYFLVAQRRKAKYREFYSNYDAECSFERMVEAGVLSSCKPPEEKN